MAERGQEQEGQFGSGGQEANFPRERLTVHVGQLQVEDGEVEGIAIPQERQGLGSGPDGEGHEAPVADQIGKDPPVRGVVVHEEELIARLGHEAISERG